jgi:hypothetical protein
MSWKELVGPVPECDVGVFPETTVNVEVVNHAGQTVGVVPVRVPVIATGADDEEFEDEGDDLDDPHFDEDEEEDDEFDSDLYDDDDDDDDDSDIDSDLEDEDDDDDE